VQLPFAIPINTSAASSSSSDPFFGSLITSMDSSGWTVNFGDGATQTATTGDRGGNSLISDPAKTTSAYPVSIPQNAGSIGTPTGAVMGPGATQQNPAAAGAQGAGLSMNMLLLFGGAVALILLWKH